MKSDSDDMTVGEAMQQGKMPSPNEKAVGRAFEEIARYQRRATPPLPDLPPPVQVLLEQRRAQEREEQRRQDAKNALLQRISISIAAGALLLTALGLLVSQ